MRAAFDCAGRISNQRLNPMSPVMSALRRAAIVAACLVLSRQAGAAEDTAITIYSSEQPGAISPDLYRPTAGAGVPNGMNVPGYALVRHERDIKFESGRSTLKFADVAGLIDPTTVTFTSLSEPRTRVLEQNFQFDLVSTANCCSSTSTNRSSWNARWGITRRRSAGRCSRPSTGWC
jgi:hypothetical protein